MEVLVNKIRQEYQSVANFCDEEGFGIGVVNGLRKRTSDHFKRGSKAYKTYKRLKALGYIKETEEIS